MLTPHTRRGRTQMAVLTSVTVGGGLLLSRLGLRFDGFLDVHRTWNGAPVSLAVAALDQLVALPLAALIAALVIRAGGGRARLSDLTLTLGTARVPLVACAPLVLAAPTPAVLLRQRIGSMEPNWGLIALGIGAVLGVTGSVVLLVAGFRALTKLRGARLAGVTVCFIVAVEVLGKLALGLAG